MLTADIIQAVGNLTAERFNQGDQVEGRGIVKTISEVQPEEYDTTLKQYQQRVEIQWFESNTEMFSSIAETIKASMFGMVQSKDHVLGVYHQVTQYGYDPERDLHILVLEFLIEHIVS